MENNILLVEELLALNEKMLGRGMPNQNDGVGYNKADYSICCNYYYGASDAQVADLANRLIKYSTTQLDIERETMKNTARYWEEISNKTGLPRGCGVSVERKDENVFISFKYNPIFVNTIRNQPTKKYDKNSKQWFMPESDAIVTLKELGKAGADVKNAINYLNKNS